MTVLQNVYSNEEHDSTLKGASIDKNKLLTNWIGEEMQKFENRQGIAMQNLNDLSIIRKMESQRNIGVIAQNESSDIKKGLKSS